MPQAGKRIRRHGLATRLWHWLNALACLVMLMSGLMILNAHPRLYWGEYGANDDAAWLAFGAVDAVPFPGWMTIPSAYSLADARLWHMAFAWVLALGLLAHLLAGLASGRLRRDIAGDGRTWPAALRYGRAQRIAYALVLLAALPAMIATGLAMAPAMDAAWPWLTQVWGGRQSARSVHFLGAMALLGFALGHVALALRSPRRLDLLRGMLTGWRAVPEDAP